MKRWNRHPFHLPSRQARVRRVSTTRSMRGGGRPKRARHTLRLRTPRGTGPTTQCAQISVRPGATIGVPGKGVPWEARAWRPRDSEGHDHEERQRCPRGRWPGKSRWGPRPSGSQPPGGGGPSMWRKIPVVSPGGWLREEGSTADISGKTTRHCCRAHVLHRQDTARYPVHTGQGISVVPGPGR